MGNARWTQTDKERATWNGLKLLCPLTQLLLIRRVADFGHFGNVGNDKEVVVGAELLIPVSVAAPSSSNLRLSLNAVRVVKGIEIVHFLVVLFVDREFLVVRQTDRLPLCFQHHPLGLQLFAHDLRGTRRDPLGTVGDVAQRRRNHVRVAVVPSAR